jgi:class 3 adenylate cyclase
MGIHCGEAAQTATGLVGLEVHRAARIAAAGHGGQVLASAILGLACLAGDTGDWHRAAMLYGVAQAFQDRTGNRWHKANAQPPGQPGPSACAPGR